MERYKCKLCLKSFANGRALGGHMRSHMFNPSPKPEEYDDEEEEEEEEEEERPSQLSDETESASSSSSDEEEEEEEEEEEDDDDDDEKGGSFYGLRENPKRSIRMADPEFSFVADPGSVVLQDRESETESSKNPTRKRSNRTWKRHQDQQDIIKKLKLSQLGSKTESWVDPEPLSSVSDTTTEEDLAFCLLMLSRDKWKTKKAEHDDNERETDEWDGYKSSKNRTKGKYRCETCNKVYKSYQALGGHRASHKKMKMFRPEPKRVTHEANAGARPKKTHECPVCFKVFASGQALGGHKRSHGIGGYMEAPLPSPAITSLTKERFIDLNLPAPIDDDDTSQIEKSVVFDEC